VRLLANLLLAPVTLPVRGLGFVFSEIREAADRELTDPDVIRRQLHDLQRRLDAGLIDEATYDASEAELRAVGTGPGNDMLRARNERNGRCR
jgi:cytochrome c-type biogenesis protein CcmH/NrfG